MRVVFGLLAVSLLGADGPSPSGAPGIAYEVKFVELNGLDWRAAVHARLQPVAHHGGATVWTAPKAVGAEIAAKATSGKDGKVLSAPKVTANSGATAHINTNSTRHYVSDLARVADGEVNRASYVAWAPKVDQAREGIALTVRGRKLDQGVLTQVAIEDNRITAVHEVKLPETVYPTQKDGKSKPQQISATFQVPEVVRCEAAGEWLIPNDGVLLVSLGAYTVAGKEGRAEVRERLAMIEAKGTVLPAAGTAPAAMPMPTAAAVLPHPIPVGVAAIPMPAPAPPSRSLPQPRNADGHPVSLPPLPEDMEPSVPASDSSEPSASPQTRRPKPTAEPVPEGRSTMPVPEDRSAKPVRDDASVRTGYEEAQDCCHEGDEECCHEAGDCPALTAAPAPPPVPRSLTFRLPNGTVTLEVRTVSKPIAVKDLKVKRD